MSNTEHIDFSTLTWVKGELDETLDRAKGTLEEFVENPEEINQIQQCANYLHQVQGTLKMVELYGAAMVAEEMEQVASDLSDGKIVDKDSAYDVLMRSILQLPDYLERIELGHKDVPMVLLPLVNDLRAVRTEKLISESALFNPNLKLGVPQRIHSAESAIEGTHLKATLAKIRTAYQLSLLKWIQGKSQEQALSNVQVLCEKLQNLVKDVEFKQTFWTFSAVLEGLKSKAIDDSVTIKQLSGKVDRIIKGMAGDSKKAKGVSRALTKNLLYYIAICESDTPLIKEVKDFFNLAQFIPDEKEIKHAKGSLTGKNKDLLQTVADAINDDVLIVQESLDLFIRNRKAEVVDLEPIVGTLDKISDTLGILGLGVSRDSIIRYQSVLSESIENNNRPSDEDLLEVAKTLLVIESQLNDHIQSLGLEVQAGDGESDGIVISPSEKALILKELAKESIINLQQIKNNFVAFIEAPWDREHILVNPKLLNEIAGAMKILNLQKAANEIARIGDFTNNYMLKSGVRPSANELDRLANVISSIEYYLENLDQNTPGKEQILEQVKSQIDQLQERSDQHQSSQQDEQAEAETIENAEHAVAEETEELGGFEFEIDAINLEEETVEEDTEAQATEEQSLDSSQMDEDDLGFSEEELGELEFELEDLDEELEEELVAVDAAESDQPESDTKPAVVDLPHLSFDSEVDDEIKEVFIEEFSEEMVNLQNIFEDWKSEPEEKQDKLSEMRRIYHTLKGSGRLVGAEHVGDYSWEFENMCNRGLDNSIEITPDFISVLQASINHMPVMLESQKSGGQVPGDYYHVMENAKRVTLGEAIVELPVEAAEEPKQPEEVEIKETQETVEAIDDSTVVDELEADATEEAVSNDGDFEFEIDDLQLEEEADENLAVSNLVGDGGDDSEEAQSSDGDVSDTDETELELDLSEIDFDEDQSLDTELSNAEENEATAELALENEEDDISSLDLNLNDEELSLDDELLSLDSDATDEDVNEDTLDFELELEETLASEESDELELELASENIDEPELLSEELNIDELNNQSSEVDEEANVEQPAEEIVETLETEETVEAVAESVDDSAHEAEEDGRLTIDPVFVEILQKEVGGHLDAIQAFAEKGPETAVTDDFIRVVHTLNGAASMASVDSIMAMTSPLEKYSKLLKQTSQNMSAEDQKHLINLVDLSRQAMAGLGTEEKVDSSSTAEYFVQQYEVIDSGELDIAAANPEYEELESDAEDSIELSEVSEDVDVEEHVEEHVEEEVAEQESSEQTDDHQEEVHEEDEHKEDEHEEVKASEQDVAVAPTIEQKDTQDVETDLNMEEYDEELLMIFKEEATDIFDRADHLLNDLENESDNMAHIQALQRDLHTLKGGARMAGLTKIGDLGHQLESLFESIASKNEAVSETRLEAISGVMHKLHSMVNMPDYGQGADLSVENKALQQLISEEGLEVTEESQLDKNFFDPLNVEAPLLPQEEVEAASDSDTTETEKPAKRTANVLSGGQIKVNSELLDRLVNFAGEVSIYRSRMEQQGGELKSNIEELANTVDRLRRQLRDLELETEAQIISNYQGEEIQEGFDPLELDQFSTIQQLSRSLSESVSDLTNIQTYLQESVRTTETLMVQQSRVNTELQEGLMETRLVTFNSMVPRLRRVIRTTGQELNKKAKLVVNGAEGEMDKTVLEGIQAPLEHMIRNSMVHGIESNRKKADKAEQGTITIDLNREATEVVIRVKDDGQGIDLKKVRKKALEKGLVKKNQRISEYDLSQMILHSGLSTANSVSKLAGRGVGMDVVDNEIKRLGGSLEILSTQGEGTEFVIRLPYTLALTQAIVVQVADRQYAIPASGVEGVIRMNYTEYLKRIENQDFDYDYAGENYQLHELNKLLGVDSEPLVENNQIPLVMIHSGDQGVALRVDQTFGGREIVVKSVGVQVASVPGIFGATILGDGSVVLILDIIPMSRSYMKKLAETDSEQDQITLMREEDLVKTVMIVDDSITMRRAGERMLARNDFEVTTAKDGVDALSKLQETIPDVMLLDIEMPRMDGYELATQMKASDKYKDIPIIMITSRTGQKHKDRAKQIGVERYLGKPYQETELLNTIAELLEDE